MSRGPGKLQQHILDTLQGSSEPLSAADLRRGYENDYKTQGWEDFQQSMTAQRRRAVRMSVGRALRQLEAAGQIKRDKAGNWHPAMDWEGRDAAKRERAAVAYHEAGHAVISLAKGVPVELATIMAKGTYAGMVKHPHKPRALGLVNSHRRVRRGGGYGYKFIEHATFDNTDAFGNPVSPSPTERNHHAHIVISIAGGMAEVSYLKGECKWNELPGVSSDLSDAKDDRRKLGENARKPKEYEAECKALVTKHWSMIEAVANRLLKEETIGGNEIYELCERIARHVVANNT
jgi:hypothetical protein